jgi:glycosyltransferase involved in cell wall biosynthesis
LKILFLTTLDPRTHPSLWSGITLSILRGLESLGHDVQVRTIGRTSVHWYGAIKYRIYRWFFNTQYMIEVDPLDLWFNRRRMRKQLRGVSFDLVFSWLPWQLLLVDTDKPKVFWYDTTFIKTHASYFPNLCAESLRYALQLDRQIARQAAAAIYPSNWARQSAINDYGALPDRVHAIPFGANMAAPTAAQVADAIDRRVTRSDRTVRLLFVGMDWERKSGGTAVDVVREMNRCGTPAKLVIVGCRPKLPVTDLAYVEIVGKLDKSNAQELSQLKSLYLDCDFFIMTSRAESYGIVYCEAMSNGMPSLATNAGGVGQIVRSDVTGYLADWGPGTVSEIAEFVARTWSDPAKYRALAESCACTFNAEFTWETNWKRLGLLLDALQDRT